VRKAAALDAAGAALGALGMLAFAIVFSVTVTRGIAGAFVGASLAWVVVSVAAWGASAAKGGRFREGRQRKK
jgi:hypothetical protein